jgi:hypothetical protein
LFSKTLKDLYLNSKTVKVQYACNNFGGFIKNISLVVQQAVCCIGSK